MPQQAHFCLWTISLAFPPEASAPCHPITCIHHDHAWHPSCLLFSSLFCPVLFPFFIASFPPDLSFPWHLPSLRSCWIYFVHKTTQHFIRAVFRITCEDQWMRGEGPRRCNASDEAGCSPPPTVKIPWEKQLCLAPLLDDSWSYNMNRQKQGRGLFWGWQPRLSAVFLWCKSPEIRTDPGS